MTKGDVAILNKMVSDATVVAVRTTVNGRLDEIRQEQREQAQTLKVHMELEDAKWMEFQQKVNPIIEVWNNWSGFKRSLIAISIIVTSLVGGITAVWQFISWIQGR